MYDTELTQGVLLLTYHLAGDRLASMLVLWVVMCAASFVDTGSYGRVVEGNSGGFLVRMGNLVFKHKAYHRSPF